MQIQGKIIHVLPLQSGVGQASGKPWKKQEYVLETVATDYPKKICFSLWGDRIEQFNIQEGEDLTVDIDVESNEYQGRWYTNVRAWNVTRGFVQQMAMPMQPVMMQPGMVQPGMVQQQVVPQPVAPQPMTAAQTVGTAPQAPQEPDQQSMDDLPF
ncbi:DUF3127 domain-containing protein [Falsiporphyromonas endometrii]|uniref:DUF3127 domain-containing protein n=1 Tax=Falsiporphyromonas endometrii TaxID=1387297 RepID=A0ABV9K8Q7_9PORP|nr:DUF3127 domain-containing protein [Porphyromonadaceae bacterium]